MMVVGRYQETGQDRAMLGTVWENEVRAATAPSGEETSSVTGLHLLYPGLLVFYVEGGEDDLNDFLRLLNNLTAKEALGLTKVKVVHMIHNIKGHMLSSWHWKVVDPPMRVRGWTTERTRSS